MDAEHRLSELEDQMARVFSRLENIEHVLGMRPSGMHPLDSATLDEIRDRITVAELASGVKG